MSIHEVPVCRLTPGAVVSYDGTKFRAWRVLPVEKPGGWGVVATRQDHTGNWDGPATILFYANDDAVALAAVS